MTDNDLIDALAADLKPTASSRPAPWLGAAVAVGGAATAAFVAFGLGVQPGLAGAGASAFLMKGVYALPLAAMAFLAAVRLARPGAPSPSALPLLAPVALLAVLSVVSLGSHPLSAAPALVMGSSWRLCPLRIVVLSLPVFAGVVLALRSQAPVRLRRTGAAAGLLAGATAAALYALACTESSPAFVLVWYSVGIAASTALGALLGPRLLRW